eukprot:269789-Rhodomonas_salina.3
MPRTDLGMVLQGVVRVRAVRVHCYQGTYLPTTAARCTDSPVLTLRMALTSLASTWLCRLR